MSYEGYTQVLCAKGHAHTFDALDDSHRNTNIAGLSQEAAVCQYCGSSFVFRHEVDETNCEPDPYLFEIDVPAVLETCNLGHIHVIEPPRFKIPERA